MAKKTKKTPGKKGKSLSKGTQMGKKPSAKVKKPGGQVASKSHLIAPQTADAKPPKQVASKSHLIKPQTA